MVHGERPQHDLSFVGQLHADGAAVGGARAAPHEVALGEPVDQFHHAVMAQLHPLAQVTDRDVGRRRALHRQEQLMLLRLKADAACGVLAGPKELPQLVAELSEGGVIDAAVIPGP